MGIETTSHQPKSARSQTVAAIVPGIGACLAIALIAAWLGSRLPLIGGAVFAILIGILVANILRMAPVTKPGITFCSKKVLPGGDHCAGRRLKPGPGLAHRA